MSKTYRPYDPEQQLLLPAALQEWLPPDHMVYLISDVVEELDLSVIMARYEGEERGGPPYHPKMLVKVLLYGYCTGVASSRRIARRLHEDIAFRVLAANNSRVPGSGVRGRGSGERETTASSLAGKEESSRKEDNGGQGKDGPAGVVAQGGNGR